MAAKDDDGLVVRFRIEDSLHHNGITLTTRAVHVRVTKPFYHWLRTKRADHELEYNFK